MDFCLWIWGNIPAQFHLPRKNKVPLTRLQKISSLDGNSIYVKKICPCLAWKISLTSNLSYTLSLAIISCPAWSTNLSLLIISYPVYPT